MFGRKGVERSHKEEATSSATEGGRISRRKLLANASKGLAILALGGAGSKVVEHVAKAITETSKSPEQKLRDNKMADFIPLYHMKKAFDGKYGEYQPYDDVYGEGGFGTPYWNLYFFMDSYVAGGWYDTQKVLWQQDDTPFTIFRDGWADSQLNGSPEQVRTTLRVQALQDAVTKVTRADVITTPPDQDVSPQDISTALGKGGMVIQLDEGLSPIVSAVDPKTGDPNYLTYIKRLATLLPAQFMFGVTKIHITRGAGSGEYSNNGGLISIGEENLHHAFESFNWISDTDLDASRSNAYVSGVHEIDHVTSIMFGCTWDSTIHVPDDLHLRGKKYVRKADLLHYYEVKLQGQIEVADAYFGMSWEEAQAFKVGHPMISGGDGDQFIDWSKGAYETISNANLAVWEKEMTNTFGVGFPPLPSDKQQDVSWRFNRYVHAVGRVLLHNPDRKQTIFQNADMAFAIHRFFGEVQHYFVGPVQRATDGLAGDTTFNRPVTENSVLEQWNMKIQAARATAFYNLPADVLEREDPVEICQAMRDHFGLQDVG